MYRLSGFIEDGTISAFLFDKRIYLLFIIPIFFLKEEEAQISGIVLVADIKSFGWKHARRLKPKVAKNMIKTLQVFHLLFIHVHLI